MPNISKGRQATNIMKSILIAVFTNTVTKEGDEVILVERARDINEMINDTGGWFYHRKTKQCFGGNIQDYRFKVK
jgi:hypothetical protein